MPHAYLAKKKKKVYIHRQSDKSVYRIIAGVIAVVNAFVNENYLTGGHGRLTLGFGPIPAVVYLTISFVIISTRPATYTAVALVHSALLCSALAPSAVSSSDHRP